ncbi:tetratricopeptide repeat protein [bacterium]|nr:tetratricopeptide repeat protein [bacterium]
MKKQKYLLLFLCTIFIISSVYALEGTVEYNSVNIDYSKLNTSKYLILGDNFLKRAENTKITKEKRNELYGEALGSYITATEINPELVDIYGKIGYIYGKLKKYTLAKSYLNKGLNMDIKNPVINYYYGIVCFDMENYNQALKYYKRAEKLKYYDKYDINFKIGETNEKLGDLVKAREAYARALSARPNDKITQAKIRSIDELKYDKSQYYYRKKPFYYD